MKDDAVRSDDAGEPDGDWSIPLTPQVRAAVERLCRCARPAGSAALAAALLSALADPAPAPASALAPVRWSDHDRYAVLFNDFAALGPRTLAKAVALTHLTRAGLGRSERAREMEQVLRAGPPPTDLMAVASLLAPFVATPQEVIGLYLNPWGTLGRELPAPAAAGYFLRHPGVVAGLLLGRPGVWTFGEGVDRSRLYRSVAALPEVPAELVTALYGLAFGSVEVDREAAQPLLARVPGVVGRVCEALRDGRAQTRTIAGGWLASLARGGRLAGHDAQTAAQALQVACRAEKQDAAKAVMLDALEALGLGVVDAIDLAALEAEARKTAAKPVVAPLAWVTWDAVPPVRWASGTGREGREVPADVVRLVLVKAVKAKSAEPNAMLRGWCGAWDAADRAALAQWLFDGWINADLARVGPEEARLLAEDRASWAMYAARTTPGHPWQGWTREQVVEALIPQTSQTPAGSAVASKGVLAVVGACGAGSEAFAPRVQRYLTDWYGMRPSQCKALLAVLAWVDAPSATALLLSVAKRFRTRSIQDEAVRLVEDLAARKGWTVDELADRTMPTAGLSDDGTLALDFGPRQFTAFVRADLTLGLRDPDDKEIKALPAPRVSDDAELAAAAKKALAASKKGLTATLKQQTARLEEALCTGRTWAFADWQEYLLGHPIVGHLVRRLVWAQVEEGVVVQAFRPLDDGTLTDVDDDAVVVAPDAQVTLAHDGSLGQDGVEAWLAHLADYQVRPPFAQLGVGFWELPEGLAAEKALTEFRGHVLEAFALRGRATKLGWTRGSSEDGGRFFEYRKRFGSLRLEAVLHFTGNQLPEENRPVALESLTFERLADGGSGWGLPTVPLGDVPAVLLSRCRGEVAAIAAEGTGFDPEWERKTGW